MADNDGRRAAIGQHRRGDIPRMSARRLFMAILRADLHGAALGGLRHGCNQRGRRADHDIGCVGMAGFREPRAKRLDFAERGAQPVHFPVSGNERSDS